jgi:hypothetical protein
MIFRSILGATVVLGMVVVGPASAGSTGGLRCGTRLVSLGDTQYEVQALCGPPDATQQQTEYRTVRRPIRVPCGDTRRAWCRAEAEDTVEVAIEEWIYDFGPRRFLQHLFFEQGRLVRVETGDRGHKLE